MVYVTDYHSGAVLKKIDTNNSFVFSLDVSADNAVFATAAQDGCVRIYSRENDWDCLRCASLSTAYRRSCSACNIMSNCIAHVTMFAALLCSVLCCLVARVRVIKQQSPGMCRIIWAVQLYTSPAGQRYCVSGGATKVIHVADCATGDEWAALRGHQEGVRCLAVAPDGTLASGSNDFTVRLW